MPVRALLLTDVVDSTKLSEELGDAAMAGLWARHDRVARDLLPAHHGREIDKTDGFLMLFEEARHAADYAVAYHASLRELGIAARAGIHVGPVILTENAPMDVARGAKPLEVDGIAKPTAARVMSIASGGQTLLTPQAVEALGPTDLRLLSHGHWRMKGVAEPIELFEIGDDDAPFTPPPDGAKVYRVVEAGGLWLPVREVKHHLPAERDAFVGRADALRNLAARLEDARLVSVLGIGGTGKTRLVTRFAWTWLGDYPGGAWFCDLSEARGRDGVLGAVARVFGVPLDGADPVQRLGRAIASHGTCLIVLDNFEQVADLAHDFLGPWLDIAPDARFVVTTREVLGVAGEAVLPLAPLDRRAAIDLFTTRANQAKHAYAPSPADQAAVASLVELLDNLPLAIELAAARVRVMPPTKLLDRMSERFKLLASHGSKPSRQATLRGALDWSWDLLDPEERAALAQLSVFEGGFTLETAEQLLRLDELWPVDAVQALVDKSLVRPVSDDRFDLLVSVQAYAAEKLGDPTETEVRHGALFAAWGGPEALAALGTDDDARRAYQDELGNLVSACRRAIGRGDAPVAVGAFCAAHALLEDQGPYAQGRELAEGVLRLPLDPGSQSAVAARLAYLLEHLGETDAASVQAGSAVASAREAGDPQRLSEALRIQGRILRGLGRLDDARTSLEEAAACGRQASSGDLEAAARHTLGDIARAVGDMEAALEHFRAAIALSRQTGNRPVLAAVLAALANAERFRGDRDAAREHYAEALAMSRELRVRGRVGFILHNLGILEKDAGNTEAARSCFEEAIAIHREVGDRNFEAVVCNALGLVEHSLGRRDVAEAQWRAGLAALEGVTTPDIKGALLCNLARAHLDRDLRTEARGFYEAALDQARLGGDRTTEGIVIGNIAELDEMLGRTHEAIAGYETAVQMHRETEFRYGLPYWLIGLARIASTAGRSTWAALIDEAVEVAAPYPLVHALALTNRVRLRVDNGELEGARADLEAAGEAYERDVPLRIAEGHLLRAEARTDAARAVAGEARKQATDGIDASTLRDLEELERLLRVEVPRDGGSG